MYLVLLSGNQEKKKLFSVPKQFQWTRKEKRRAHQQVSLPCFSPFGNLASQENSVPAGSAGVVPPC